MCGFPRIEFLRVYLLMALALVAGTIACIMIG